MLVYLIFEPQHHQIHLLNSRRLLATTPSRHWFSLNFLRNMWIYSASYWVWQMIWYADISHTEASEPYLAKSPFPNPMYPKWHVWLLSLPYSCSYLNLSVDLARTTANDSYINVIDRILKGGSCRGISVHVWPFLPTDYLQGKCRSLQSSEASSRPPSEWIRQVSWTFHFSW